MAYERRFGAKTPDDFKGGHHFSRCGVRCGGGENKCTPFFVTIKYNLVTNCTKSKKSTLLKQNLNTSI